MGNESQGYPKVTIAYSALLSIAGLIQTSACIIFLTTLHPLHLVLQVLAGFWALLVGWISLSSSCRKEMVNESLHVLQIRALLVFNFALETTALVFLAMDFAGLQLWMKTYLSRTLSRSGIQTSNFKLSIVGAVVLISSGSVALLMGLARLVGTLACLQGKDEESDSDGEVFSSQWSYKGKGQVFFRAPKCPSFYQQKKTIFNKNFAADEKEDLHGMPDCEPAKVFRMKNRISWKYTNKKAKRSPVCRITFFERLGSEDENNNTYIRFYEYDDVPLHCPAFASNKEESIATQPAFNDHTPPGRAPFHASTPAPNYYSEDAATTDSFAVNLDATLTRAQMIYNDGSGRRSHGRASSTSSEYFSVASFPISLSPTSVRPTGYRNQ